MKKFLLAATALGLAVAAPASAAQITYTFNATVGGTIAGNGFSNVNATFVGIGDTDDLVTSNGIGTISLASITALANGLTYTISTPASFFAFGNNTGIFFGSSIFDSNGFGFYVGGYDAVSNLDTTSVDIYFTKASFDTDFGAATVTEATNGTFSASVAAVPEPATWGLMALGFGMIGAGMRRRKANLVAA